MKKKGIDLLKIWRLLGITAIVLTAIVAGHKLALEYRSNQLATIDNHLASAKNRQLIERLQLRMYTTEIKLARNRIL